MGVLKLYPEKKENRGVFLTLFAFLVVLSLFWYGFQSAEDADRAESLQATRAAVQKAVVSCYAIEGVYPPDLRYLQDHYGVTVDTQKYAVRYEATGTNVMPSIEIQERGKGENTP